MNVEPVVRLSKWIQVYEIADILIYRMVNGKVVLTCRTEQARNGIRRKRYI